MDNLHFKICLEGGGVKSLLFHTVPPTIKTVFKICFPPFHEPVDSFSFCKNRVPGNLSGMRSWMTSRNAFLGHLQEHAPQLAFETFSGTGLEC